MDWFLYDKDLRHERVNQNKAMIRLSKTGTKDIPYQILLHKEQKDDKVYILKISFPSL